MAISLAPSAPAFASPAHFRYYHAEPLNDLRVTPGATFRVSVATICRSGYSSSVRDVPESEKNQVYAEYGITHRTTGQYEIDHLISLELGGSNAISNLWPEPNDHPRGYLNSKDILENRLHALLCAGQVSLHIVQTLIAGNWVSAYHRFFGLWPEAPAPIAAATTTTASGGTTPGGHVRVTALIGSVLPGSRESLTVHSSTPRDSCTLVVILPSGRQSTENGLGATRANAGGNATWTWTIGATTGAGTAHLTASCGAGRAVDTFRIT
jgi:hypothetical protein